MIRILNYCVKYSEIKYLRYFESDNCVRINFGDCYIDIYNVSEDLYADICKTLAFYKEVKK